MATTSSSATKGTLPSDGEILITREFEGPRDVVFKAMTDPRLIPQWWGPRGYTTIVDKMDVRPGGAWRFITREPDGRETGFRGEYREVAGADRADLRVGADGGAHLGGDSDVHRTRQTNSVDQPHALGVQRGSRRDDPERDGEGPHGDTRPLRRAPGPASRRSPDRAPLALRFRVTGVSAMPDAGAR